MNIDVRSKQNEVKISVKWVKRLLNLVLREEQREGELSVLFVDDDTMTELNKTYRKKLGPTDVLAFQGNTTDHPNAILGDIVISTSTALRQARTRKLPILHEIAFLLIHGLLHLLGYDHHKPKEREVMFSKQDALLSRFLHE